MIHPGLAQKPALSDDNFLFLQQKIYSNSGIVIERPKQYLLEARLTPVVRNLRLKSLDELCKVVRTTSDASVLNAVIEAMTTHETYFFRDEPHFQALKSTVIPELMARRKRRMKLRFWSAAASCGQEAYSLAMLLCELRNPVWTFEILGTDISERILTRARAARYTAHEVSRGLPQDLVAKYMERLGEEFVVREPVRRMVQFQKFDLRSPMRPLGVFDVIFCRNVLIYFDLPTKRGILNEIASVLAPDGALFLGSTETTIGITDRYQRKHQSGAVYYTGGNGP
jgi:chemotaxis protein methyltransferase CheR